jgi:hypothetical protein
MAASRTAVVSPATDLATAQEMLLLSMLSYRAYHDLRPGELRLGHLRTAVRRGLDELSQFEDRWELVWGPAAYRAPFTVFDENVMFVVRDRVDPGRFAISIRGTNPVSAADWLFGDLWTGVLTPWNHGDPETWNGAAISLSTALGINVLLHLHDPGPRPGAVARLWRHADEDIGDLVRATGRMVLEPFGGVAATALERLRLDLRAALRRAKHQREGMATADAVKRLNAAVAFRTSEDARRIRRLLASNGVVVDAERQQDVLRLLEGTFRVRTRLAPGATVLEFLRSAARETQGPIEVTVTGHSKGGALAPTFALALHQLRGKAHVRRRDRWDPDQRATVHCYSFAGPSAGNVAFAELSNRTIGDRCHRIANRLDIVPHAWMTRPTPRARGLYIENIPRVYGDEVHELRGLRKLAGAVAADVEPLGYTHVGKHVTLLDGTVDPKRRLFLEQVAYQHMEAYLELLGLGSLTTEDFFSPLL